MAWPAACLKVLSLPVTRWAVQPPSVGSDHEYSNDASRADALSKLLASPSHSAGRLFLVKLSTWENNPVFGSRPKIPADRYLFHYTSVERCAAIGFTACIALGPLTPLNDPRESQLRQSLQDAASRAARPSGSRTTCAVDSIHPTLPFASATPERWCRASKAARPPTSAATSS